MAVAPKPQVLYRRDGDIFLGWLPLDKTEAKSYNLYGALTSAGVYSLVKSSILNQIDKNYKNKVCTLVKDLDIPIPVNSRYYFKLTFLDLADVESNINLSPVTTVYPSTVDLHYEGEQQEANNHNFGWVEQNQRWEKLLLTADGKLMCDATVDIGSITIGNVKIAARPDGVTLEYVLVDNNRRVVVSDDPTSVNRVRDYEEKTTVLPNIETIILTYTNPQSYYLEKIICSGTADAKFKVKLNGTAIETLRNSWNNRNIAFDFTNKSVYCSAGTTVTVTAVHAEKTAQDYESSLFGFTYSY
jgi:hypothetical protein